ncbi:MAG: hypothetical protein RR763_09440 [Massilia sp.]
MPMRERIIQYWAGLALLAAALYAGAPALAATSGAEGALTSIGILNTGAAQSGTPFTFGQAFAPGRLRSGQGLSGRLANGAAVALQADVKASHADGSVRHAIVSGVLPELAPRQLTRLELLPAAAPAPVRPSSLRQLAAAGLDGKVTIAVDGTRYTASLTEALAADKASAWLSGPVVSEWLLDVPLKNAAGQLHPLLTVRFDVRWYSALTKQARIDVIIENAKTFAAGARNLDYDVEIEIAGRLAYALVGLSHYHHARWRHSTWWDPQRAPELHLQPDVANLIATGAVPNYDRSVIPDGRALDALGKRLDTKEAGPMKIGPLTAYMPTAGGRNDIGPLPGFSVLYLLSMDARARAAMMAAADGSGSWPIHYRDERTGYPVRTDSAANKGITTHGNLAHRGPLPVPRCAADGSCKTPYSPDTAHQPSLAYLPYLLTGDYYYLEELQFWAASNPLGTDPGNAGDGQGLVRWQQVRGQAWSLRTLGHAAYITPDAHPLKAYFTKQVDNNLAFYHAAYVAGNPNRLGLYDGSGRRAFQINGSAPWQDDFLTWSFGHLAELGFSKALPILEWKAKYAVGRMTAPGYCWIQGAAYSLKFRDDKGSPPFDNFARLYTANFGGDSIAADGKVIKHPQGLRYIDQECASQAQADWLSAASNHGWERGRMAGYASSANGFPANMQPALALAATYGIDGAERAWAIFAGRANKPNYGGAPQWAIVPRVAPVGSNEKSVTRRARDATP